MAVSIAELGIHQLSVVDRLELIEQIWDSLPDGVSIDEVPDWHKEELAKRRADAVSQPGLGKPFREVLRSVEKQG